MIRKATIEDVKAIYTQLKYYGQKGELLARPLSRIYDHLRDFWVYVDSEPENGVVGCCALQFCWEELAEIRSLAVAENRRHQGIGTQLVKAVFEEASKFKVNKLFALTYKPEFFAKFGFRQIDRSELPIKIWADCIYCVKFPECDEIAMIKDLS
jgi:amino-acid N-acetyltransferase